MGEPKFRAGDRVVLRARPDEPGTVEAEPEREAGEYWYRVRFGRRLDTVVEEELAAIEDPEETIESLVLRGAWGRVEAFNRALAIERIRSKNRSTLYAFNAQRVLFQPHQYKPLLRFLESSDRRLLIADEVGLGKTIEAGLILAELTARQDLDKVLVVCPSRLREKWCEEMNRKFAQDFTIYDRPRLSEEVARMRGSVVRRPFRGVVSMQTMRRDDLLRPFLEVTEGVDLLVVDEAHHGRNPDTQTSHMIADLADAAQAALLLTATPMHLGNRDVFTVLAALRPRQFRNYEVFDADLRRNEGVVRAQAAIRSRDARRVAGAAQELRRVFEAPLTREIEDPMARLVLQRLEGAVPSARGEWIELERQVEALHLLADIVSRTRKRDVQMHVPERRSRPLVFAWSAEEQRLYDQLSGTGRYTGPGVSLGQIQRARQAASCLPAAVAARREDSVTGDEWAEHSDIDPSLLNGIQGQGDAAPTDVTWAKDIPDTKFAQLLQILRFIDEDDPGAKVIVFTFFVGTSKYLARRLAEEGWPTRRIAGDVPSRPHDPRNDIRGHALADFREDPSVRVLVSTEVGSEGLDFQFCHHVVNYDLPWNPMVVEQRIGRVDRFGQKSDVVYIHSLVVAGSIEERILSKLYDRIRLFEVSIGMMETILGEMIGQLQRDFVTGRLTPSELDRRIEEVAEAIERKRRDLAEVEQRSGELFGHEEYIREEVERVGRLGRFITPEAILALVDGYLRRDFPSVRIKDEGAGIWSMNLPEDLFHNVQTRSGVTLWEGYTRCRNERGRLLFTTDGQVAFERPNVDLFNVMHPIVRSAVDALGATLDHGNARVGQAVVETDPEDELPEGVAYVVVYTQAVEGIRRRRTLTSLAWSAATADLLAPEAAERLLYLVSRQGRVWDLKADAPPIPTTVWERIRSGARAGSRELKAREKAENEALFVRRLRTAEAEYEHRKGHVERRLETSRRRGEETGIRLFEAQLVRARSRFEEIRQGLERGKEVAVALSAEPLAACAVDVRRGKGGRS